MDIQFFSLLSSSGSYATIYISQKNSNDLFIDGKYALCWVELNR